MASSTSYQPSVSSTLVSEQSNETAGQDEQDSSLSSSAAMSFRPPEIPPNSRSNFMTTPSKTNKIMDSEIADTSITSNMTLTPTHNAHNMSASNFSAVTNSANSTASNSSVFLTLRNWFKPNWRKKENNKASSASSPGGLSITPTKSGSNGAGRVLSPSSPPVTDKKHHLSDEHAGAQKKSSYSSPFNLFSSSESRNKKNSDTGTKIKKNKVKKGMDGVSKSSDENNKSNGASSSSVATTIHMANSTIVNTLHHNNNGMTFSTPLRNFTNDCNFNSSQQQQAIISNNIPGGSMDNMDTTNENCKFS